MNKQEKLICFVLGLALLWCFFSSSGRKADPAPAADGETPVAVTNETTAAEAALPVDAVTNAVTSTVAEATPNTAAAVTDAAPAVVEPVKPTVPEEIVVLENDELRLELSTWGAVVKKATLKKFAVGIGPQSETNPALFFDYADAPLGQLDGVPGADGSVAYTVATNSETSVTFTAGGVTRTYTLGENYSLKLDEAFAEGCRPAGRNGLCLGVMKRGARETDMVSVDSWQGDAQTGKVIHHGDDDSPIKPWLTGAAGGGCSCSCGSAAVAPGMPVVNGSDMMGHQDWIALKDRFFVTALVSSSQSNNGFSAKVRRDERLPTYRAVDVTASANFEGGVESRTSVFFIGPKKQALLWDLGSGMKDVMEFGMWRWICYPVVWLLNACYAVIPNYGVAVILLTILVRLIFWPLTRKSTEGMKKMQELQPLLKELQAKYKDNPQRLQQETFALYREKKVNPLSSCLPMLIQIPVFIALFNVLRTAVELRYAGFLWIADLSEPEHLFASWFPFFGGLNILPILMAVTMYFQSKLTPSAGDPSQQKMMTLFMPIMMLVMFYNFASALSLYWTLSQVISIVQMGMIRRQSERKRKVFEPEIIDPPTPTRQQRRHS